MPDEQLEDRKTSGRHLDDQSRDARAASFAPLLAHEGWSLYGAQRAQPSGNRLQIPSGEGTQKQAKNVAVGCNRLPRQVHGKEGVDGSSPSEGFEFSRA